MIDFAAKKHSLPSGSQMLNSIWYTILLPSLTNETYNLISFCEHFNICTIRADLKDERLYYLRWKETKLDKSVMLNFYRKPKQKHRIKTLMKETPDKKIKKMCSETDAFHRTVSDTSFILLMTWTVGIFSWVIMLLARLYVLLHP